MGYLRLTGAIVAGIVVAISACGLSVVGSNEATPADGADANTVASDGSSTPTPANEAGFVDDAGGNGNDVGSDAKVDANASATCDEPDLIARWRLQEGTGTRVFDCTSGAHHGDFVGAVKWAVGRPGRMAVSFDGTTGMQIDMGNAPDVQLTGAMTVASWVYVRSAGTDGRLLSKGGDVGDRGWDVKMELADGSLELRVANDANVQKQLFAAPNFPLSTWKHVAAVYSPALFVRLYIDGQKVVESTTSVPAAQRNSTAHVLIGARTGCCTLDGMVDDARIYKRALVDAEVAALFAAK